MEHTHRDKRRSMLRLLSKALEEVQAQHGTSQLVLDYYARRDASRLLVHPTEQDIAGDLELNGAQAIGLLEELGDDGRLRLDYGRLGRGTTGQIRVGFTGLGREEMNSAIPASQEEIWAVKHRLQQHDFVVALNHLNQAESAFVRREWEAANGQIRSCMEEVFNRVAELKLGTKKAGGQARDELQKEGLLPPYEAKLVQATFPVAGGAGSHPGMSGEDESRGRFLIGLGICYIGLSLLAES